MFDYIFMYISSIQQIAKFLLSFVYSSNMIWYLEWDWFWEAILFYFTLYSYGVI